MKYNTLCHTDLKVSRICLGSMNWGEQNTESEAHEQLDYAISQGINFIDTAELYPVPSRAKTQGFSEKFIGNWLKKRKNREHIILASKVIGKDKERAYIRNGKTPRLDRKNIRYAIDNSLRRLQTDYIDLYQIHWPDRDTNRFGQKGYIHNPNDKPVSIEETLYALEELIREGKVRYIGISNETPWGIFEYLRLNREKKLPRIQTLQNLYNLLTREFEIGLSEICTREEISLLAYSPLSFGVLTGKYLTGYFPIGSRFHYANGRNEPHFNAPEVQPAIRKYTELAKRFGISPAQMAIKFVESQSFVSSVIIGATSLEQLKIDIESINISLNKEILSSIEEIHKMHPNLIS